MMNYAETIHYLYTSVPVFQYAGPSAYKPGLGTSLALDDALGHPHQCYQTIHIAGTNGKGSVSHLLAATLTEAGYKVGLFTSPHLLDFRERIRVNGQMIPEAYVVSFVEQHRTDFEPLHPSFFELTSALAFDYFRHAKVDIAVIETGLGGRLDSTNIIHPMLSVITNISLDHTQFLGDTVEQIAAEKAGIIKEGIPIVIGEASQEGVHKVFEEKAKEMHAPIIWAEQEQQLKSSQRTEKGYWLFKTDHYGELIGELGGEVQTKNAATVLSALAYLEKAGLQITQEHVHTAFRYVVEKTGLMGRWQTLQEKPLVVCDTGHNVGGWEYLHQQLTEATQKYKHLYMVVGMVGDKDIDSVLSLMPHEATYLFTQASVQRAMPVADFAAHARKQGLQGEICTTVQIAIKTALSRMQEEDMLFIGGSTFVVADALPMFLSQTNEKLI